MDRNKLGYWITTLLMCALFAFSAGMYLTKYEMISQYFPALGFPSWLVLPLAIAKILGIVAVLSRKSKLLKEWAYAGFFFDAVLAFGAHYYTDGGYMLSVIGIILVVASRYFETLHFKHSATI